MQSFEYSNTTKIIFGNKAENAVAKEIAPYSNRVLIVCSRGASNKSGIVDRVEDILTEAGIAFTELTGIKPNPEVGKVYEGIDIVKAKNIGLILAIGGGSIIDTAKGIAAGALYDGDVWDLYEKQRVEAALPVGVVLTFPAAGSEASLASVLSNDKTEEKLDILGLCIRPQFAILNPELTLTLPDYQTFCGITDMLSHVMERYFSMDMDNDFTDRLCEGTMKSIIKNALILKEERRDDLTARSNIMWASTIAHNGLLETGRDMDWASHGIGMAISAIYDTTHGATLSVITPAWARYVYQNNIKRFAQFAERVFDVEPDLNNLERMATEGIVRLQAFFERIGMPTRLDEIDIKSDDQFEAIAKKATKRGDIGGIKQLNAKDICEILKSAK